MENRKRKLKTSTRRTNRIIKTKIEDTISLLESSNPPTLNSANNYFDFGILILLFWYFDFGKKMFTSFQKANYAAAKAVEVSDFEKEESLPFKRKRIPKRKFSTTSKESSSDEESYHIPELPSIPKVIPQKNIPETSQPQAQIIQNYRIPACSISECSTVQTEISQSKAQITQNYRIPACSISESSTVQIELSESSESTAPKSSSLGDIDAFQKQVIRYLISIQTRLRDHTDTLQLILEKMDRIDTDNNIQIDVEKEDEEVQLANKFPIQNEESLQEIEDFLSEKNNVQKVVDFVLSVGERNTSEFMRRVLARMLSDKLVSGYSWIGHKGKKPFCNLKLANVLKCAVRKFNENDWSEKEIELSAAKWLAKATDRLKKVSKTNIP